MKNEISAVIDEELNGYQRDCWREREGEREISGQKWLPVVHCGQFFQYKKIITFFLYIKNQKYNL